MSDDQEHSLRKRVEADWFKYDATPDKKEEVIHKAFVESHPTDASKKAARKKYEDRQLNQFGCLTVSLPQLSSNID